MPAKEKDAKPAPPKQAAKGAAKPAAPKKAAASKKPAAAAGKAPAKGAPAKGAPAKKEEKKSGSRFKQLYRKSEYRPGVGQSIRRKNEDLTRYVKWPRYIRIDRQRKILYARLKVPPTINQFTRVLDRNAHQALFKLANKYRPEEHQEKRKRLLAVAAARLKGEVTESAKKPLTVVFGAHEVTKAIEKKKAKLVVLAGDTDPIELVLALPALSRKLDIPYVIVPRKADLGKIARRKTAAAIAFIDVRKEDKTELANLAAIAREQFNENIEHRRTWGGGKLGQKSAAKIAKRQRLIAKEIAARTKPQAAK